MTSKRIIFVTFIIATCLGLGGCGKKEVAPEATQEMENTVQEEAVNDKLEEELTPEQEEYLKLATEIDVLQQKKTMILSYYNNPELVMPIEQSSELMSAEERLGNTLKEDSSGEEVYTIKNMRDFWLIYNNLKGSANSDEIPNDQLDQAIQELKTQKSDLEEEVVVMEDELRSINF